ncbi:MAG TPA: hypothetical protein VFW21_03755 [Mycobacterium sp.]|nr:hypothetical protein [Mycobacterium sp.]
MVAEHLDTASLPITEAHPAPGFDTGPHPDALAALGAVGLLEDVDDFTPDLGPDPDKPADATAHVRPMPMPVAPHVAPSQYQYVKRWRLALVLAGVWVIAAALGLAMFYRWFHAVDKTWPDFLVLVYVMACTVAALLVVLRERTPLTTVLGIGIMSAPFASGCAAAVLYGAYAFHWLTP